MWHLYGAPSQAGTFIWNLDIIRPQPKSYEFTISFHFPAHRKFPTKKEIVTDLEDLLRKNNEQWITRRSSTWIIDLDKAKEKMPEDAQKELEWVTGVVAVDPEYEQDYEPGAIAKTFYEASLCFYITPETLEGNIAMRNATDIPVEISNSLQLFRADHPAPSNVAFIMMKFGATQLHAQILASIKSALKSFGIVGVRADDKQYHDDLFPNVQTYMHGCDFGIAVFDRVEADDINPNVTLEVGYMSAYKKPICLLKEKTLRAMSTDLVGKLYKDFDAQNIEATISSALQKWLEDKGIIKSEDQTQLEWVPQATSKNYKATITIDKYPRDYRVFNDGDGSTRIEGFVEGEECFVQQLKKFIATERYKYPIYSDAYGVEQALSIYDINDATEFQRQCESLASQIISQFSEYLEQIYKMSRKADCLQIEMKVKGQPNTLVVKTFKGSPWRHE